MASCNGAAAGEGCVAAVHTITLASGRIALVAISTADTAARDSGWVDITLLPKRPSVGYAWRNELAARGQRH